MRGQEEHNEGVPLSTPAALTSHNLLKETKTEEGGEERRRQPNGGEERWRGAGATDFVN